MCVRVCVSFRTSSVSRIPSWKSIVWMRTPHCSWSTGQRQDVTSSHTHTKFTFNTYGCFCHGVTCVLVIRPWWTTWILSGKHSKSPSTHSVTGTTSASCRYAHAHEYICTIHTHTNSHTYSIYTRKQTLIRDGHAHEWLMKAKVMYIQVLYIQIESCINR